MSDFANMLASAGLDPALAVGDGNNSDETPDELADDATEDTGEEVEEVVDNAEATDEQSFDPSTLSPELQAAYRQMQAGFTPKLQRASELEKQFGDLNPELVNELRQLQTMLQQNPRQAREYLQQQVEYLDQQYQLAEPQDPFAGVEPITPTEEALLKVARDMWRQQQENDRFIQQSQLRAQQEATERTFSELARQYKVEIPLEEKQQAQRLVQQGLAGDVGVAWKALNFEKAMKLGADKASKAVQQKKKMPAAPGGKVTRTTSDTGAKPKGIAGHFEQAWKQHGGG